LLVLIILSGFLLRLYCIDTQSLWYDETVSAYLASQTIPDLITHTARDIHPPGYYLLLHLWLGVAGKSQFALAFFSVIFGMLLIPLTYLLTRCLVNQTAAVWVVFILAASPYHIWYSQEVRMYTLGATLGLMAAYCAFQALTVIPRRLYRYWLGYLCAGAFGLYVLYYFAFLLIALNLFLLAYICFPKVKTALLKPMLIANALIITAYLPWLPIAWRQATTPPVPPWRSLPDLWSVALESWTALSLGQSAEPVTVWPVLFLTFALLVLGIYHLSIMTETQKMVRPLFLVIHTFGPLLLIYLLSLITPLYHVRYLFTYSPAFYVLLAAGLVWLQARTGRWLALGTAGLLVAASGYSIYQLHFNPRYHTDDYRAAVRFIQSQWQPGDVILINAGYVYTAFLYYAEAPHLLQRHRLLPYQPPSNTDIPLLLQTGTIAGDSRLGWGDPHSDFYAMDTGETIAALEQLSQDFARVWQLRAYDTVTDPQGLIRTWLAENAVPLEDQPFPGESAIRVQGFLLTPPPPPQGQTILFEDGMALAGWYLPQQNWQAGQIIPIRLWWTAAASPSVDYKMSLKLWRPTGELAAQGQDVWPVGALYRATRWPIGQVVYQPTSLQLPPNLPAGQYWLNVELYHPDTIQPLPRQDNVETAVTLGPVTIEYPP
jgi:4-amino-4-deoxy-L-arabinose transferase-like glycosyltransferase